MKNRSGQRENADWAYRPLVAGARAVLACAGCMGSAHATTDYCSSGQAWLEPSPTSIVLPAGLPVNGNVYTGLLRSRFRCAFRAPLSTDDDFVMVGGLTAIDLPGTTYRVVRNGPASISGDNCTFGPAQDWGAQGLTVWTPISISGTGICTFDAAVPIRIYNHSVPASGDIPSDSQAMNSGQSGWAGMDQPANGVWYTAGIPTVPVRYVACTLAASNMTVVLPTTPTSTLDASGKTAGEVPFTIGLTGCNYAGSSYTVKATWSFDSIPGLPTVIANSADPSLRAGAVGVQIRTATGTPVANGDAVDIAHVTAAGNYAATFSARYYASGPSTAGLVSAVATFTLTYE